MEIFSALLPFVRGQRPVTRSFDDFFDLCLDKRLRNNREAGDTRRYRAHYDVTIMRKTFPFDSFATYENKIIFAYTCAQKKNCNKDISAFIAVDSRFA